MGSEQNQPDVEKLLTYVFEDDALLPDTALGLADGVFLAPMPGFLLEQHEEWDLRTVFFRDHLHTVTLNVAYPGRSDLNYEGKDSPESDAYRKADHYVLAAMLYRPEFVPPYACFVTIPTQQKICHSKGIMAFGPLDGGRLQPLTQSDFAAVDDLYGSLRQVLPPDATGRLPTALAYYHQAFRSDIRWPVRFMSMMIGIEAMFSHGASEISHQVSERAAFFLRQDATERERVYEEMRHFYKQRSKIGHGGAAKGNPQELQAWFRELLMLLRESLVKVLSDPSLLDLFHNGGGKQFTKAMRDLVFRGQIEPEV